MTPATGTDHVALAQEGDEHSRAEWEQAAAAVLRKARRLPEEAPDTDVWNRLAQTTLDGIEVAPLGTAESVSGTAPTGAPGEFPYARGRLAERPEHGWDIRAHVGALGAEAAREATLLDLENGVTSVWLTLGGPLAVDDLPRALDGVLLDLAPVVVESADDPVGAARALADLIERTGTAPAEGTNLGADPIGARLRRSATAEPSEATDATESPSTTESTGVEATSGVTAVVSAVTELARAHGTLALVVDATAVHDLGASDGQELGWSLAVGAAYLRELTALGLTVEQALGLIEFRYAATDEQFATIAKLRAARRLWARVAELSGAAPESAGQRQHVVTSRPMMSTRDPWVNMLRTTVAAFAAGVGGADAVTVLPFDSPLGRPETLGRRNARNTSSLLVWESRVATVADPAGGSYAVERLTDDLAAAGWAELDRIEQSGGAEAALDDGSLLGRIAAVAARRDDDVAHRRRPLTGVSEFPDPGEVPLEREPDPVAPVARRYGAAFEQLRDTPATAPVFLATLGTIAAHTARATFAANLFAAGGVPVTVAGPTDGVESLVAAYAGERVVCLCGTDAAYTQWGADAVAALRTAGAQWVVLAGKPGPRTVAPDLIDDSAAGGVDALALLNRTREKLA